MIAERALLDNLQGRINALTALCTAMVATSKDAGKIMTVFQKELQEMHKADAAAKSNNYFIGLNAIHDHLARAVHRVQPDLALLAGETSREQR